MLHTQYYTMYVICIHMYFVDYTTVMESIGRITEYVFFHTIIQVTGPLESVTQCGRRTAR